MSTIRFDGSTPIISVLLPVYNAERYLHQAVDSLLAQTFPNFELIGTGRWKHGLITIYLAPV